MSNGDDTTRLLIVMSGTVLEQRPSSSIVREVPALTPLDPQAVMPFLCKQLKDLTSPEQMGWSGPQGARQKESGLRVKLPKIVSRPSTQRPVSPLPGGRFVARDEAKLFEIDVSDFQAYLEQFAVAEKEREGSAGYLASFLASLDIFSTWPWFEILELAKSFKGIQIDKGVSLFSQEERVDGLHVIHRGEAQMEFNEAAERPGGIASHGSGSAEGTRSLGADQVAYGYAVEITADSEGLPMTRVSKKRNSKAIGLTVNLCHLPLVMLQFFSVARCANLRSD